nr:aldo/keto reductase family protein [Stenotrophomonas indicatrix]
MQYRYLGRTGLSVSVLGLGTWLSVGQRLSNSDGARLLSQAYHGGINLFDTAQNYGWGQAQSELGRAIRDAGWQRDTYSICSKAFYGAKPDDQLKPTQRGLGRKHLVEECDAALKRLGMEYLDIYLCHSQDANVSVGEIVWTMHSLIMQGKVMHWGTSKWPAELVAEAHDFALSNHLIGPSVEQPEYNLVATRAVEEDLPDLIDRYGMGLLTWSPLKQGILAGRYDQGIPPGSRLSFRDFTTLRDRAGEAQFLRWVEAAKGIERISKALGVSRAQLAVAWCLRNRLVSSVLLGCSGGAQLAECLKSVDVASSITPELWLELHSLGQC